MRDASAELPLKVQRQLEKIYEIESEHSVGEFLVHDKKLVESVGHDVPEKLLVRDRGEEIDLALYLDKELLARLAGADPTLRLDEENLADYCVVAEGVSHFVYLTWNAARERSVTLLELELQAEVDKFASTLFWMGAQDEGRVPAALSTLLFDGVTYHDGLDEEGLSRYETANRLARKYCSRLEARYLDRRRVEEMLEDLRRFYRLPREEKLRAAHAPV